MTPSQPSNKSPPVPQTLGFLLLDNFTLISLASAIEPLRMANAMKLAVEAGRDAFLAGRMPRRQSAEPSSPFAGRING